VSKSLNCCGNLIKPTRKKIDTEDGTKIFKFGYCNNHKCKCFNLIIETINIFGRATETKLKGKRAKKELEDHKSLFDFKPQKQYKKNTAKGFHYAKFEYNVKEKKYIQAIRELSTDRKVETFSSELIAARLEGQLNAMSTN